MSLNQNLVLPASEDDGENSREYRQEREFAATRAKVGTGLSVRTA